MIRSARETDIPAILALIRELAEHVGEPDAVRTTDVQLASALFAEQPLVHALIAEQDGAVAGCAIWYVTFSTWTGRAGIYLEDLVVAAELRGLGHGRALLAELARSCVERGYGRLEWTVYTSIASALAFYAALGSDRLDHWKVHRVDGPALANLAGPSPQTSPQTSP